jgi:hypothetical protein
MWRIRMLLVVIIILAGGIIGVSAELSAEYSADITDSMDIPAQTVDTEWGEATITEVGKEESEESLEVSTDAPENESYAIRIVDSQERNLESEFVDDGGDVETSFPLDRYEPGTYVIALTQNSGDTAVEVEPFVVKGYTLDQSVSDLTKGDTITVEIELTKINDHTSDPQAVNVTLLGDGAVRSIEATSTGEDSYQAQFNTDELSTGSYDIYTGVETNDDIYGYAELIGLSDSASVTIEDSETPTPKPEDPADTDNIGDGSSVKNNETPTATPTPTVEERPTGTAQVSSSPISTQSNVTEITQTETQRQASESTAVETPPQPTPSKTEPKSMTTSSEMPLFQSGGIIILFGILIGVLHRIRCSN